MNYNENLFDLNPSRQATYVNPYTGKSINALNLTALSKSTEDTGFTKEELAALEKDKELIKELEEKGEDLPDYLSKLQSKLPKGAKLADLYKDVKLPDVNMYIDSIKSKGGSSLDNVKPGIIGSLIKYTKKLGNIAQILNLEDKLEEVTGIVNAASVFSGATEGSFIIVAVKQLLENNSKSDVWGKLAKTNLPDKLNEVILKEAFDLCAKYGSYTGCYEIIRYNPRVIDRSRRKKAVGAILKGFRHKDEDYTFGKFKVADEVKRHLDLISPRWQFVTDGDESTGIYDQSVWIEATPECCELMCYASGILVPPSVQLAFQPKVESLAELGPKYYGSLAAMGQPRQLTGDML